MLGSLHSTVLLLLLLFLVHLSLEHGGVLALDDLLHDVMGGVVRVAPLGSLDASKQAKLLQT